jgi:hypothetical protein
MFRHALSENWLRHRALASERATECSERYRSSYVAVFLLATISLIASAIAPEVEAKGVQVTAIAVEFGALLMLGGLVVADGFTRWQARAIDYRLLGELCRKQQALAPLGWVVPRASAWATTEKHPPRENDAPRIEPISWVAWLFSAWLRDTPVVDGAFNAESVAGPRQRRCATCWMTRSDTTPAGACGCIAPVSALSCLARYYSVCWCRWC